MLFSSFVTFSFSVRKSEKESVYKVLKKICSLCVTLLTRFFIVTLNCLKCGKKKKIAHQKTETA